MGRLHKHDFSGFLEDAEPKNPAIEDGLKEKQRFYSDSNEYQNWIEIMAIRGEWIMARRKFAMPFIQSKTEFLKRLADEDFTLHIKSTK